MPIRKDGTYIVDDKEIRAETTEELVKKLLKQADKINESNKNNKLKDTNA